MRRCWRAAPRSSAGWSGRLQPDPGTTGQAAATDRRKPYPVTPDGRYFVVRGRLWRTSNPTLPTAERARLVQDLMQARRVRDRAATDIAKRALGERGPVWWDDGAPDLNRHMARNTPYAEWYASLGID